MTSNSERFEAWYLAEFWEGSNGGRAMLKKEPCGGYTYAKPQELWKVWQAAQPAAGEPVEIEVPTFSHEGMGCVLEDRGITDRYEAMEYGYNEALEQQWEIIKSHGPLFSAPPAAAHGDEAVRWVPCSERLPEVAQFDQQEFIVSVQRKDKVITMSALYLNAYPLYCEDHDDADDEGYVPHTGWYDAKSNGDDANCYTLVNDSWYGSTVTHWMPMPAPAAMRAQAGEGGEV